MPKIASKIEPTFEGDVLDHDRVGGLAEALDGKSSVIPLQNSVYSHAFLDDERNILALIERATGRWKLALTADAIAAAGDRTSNDVPQTPAGVEAQVDAKLSENYGDFGVRVMNHSRYSHALTDENNTVLAYIERATGRWLMGFTPDTFASAADDTSTMLPQTPAGVARQAKAAVNDRLGSFAIAPMMHTRWSHALVDEGRNILGLVERATGKWLFALSDDTVISPQTILGDVRFGMQDPARSGFILPIHDAAKNLLGGWRRDGRLLASLTDDSVIPAGAVAVAVRGLLAANNMAIPSGRLYYSGDSLTAGAGGGGVNYGLVMATLLGLPYVNLAVGGTRSDSIGVRQGGIPMNLTLSADLPADTSEVDVSAYFKEYTNNQGPQTVNGVLAGIPVVLRRYSSASPNEATTLKYTVRRQIAGSSAVAIPAGTRFYPTPANGNELDFHYIQAGQNNAKATRADRIAIRDDILTMIDRIGHDRFGVIALKPTGINEISGTAGYDLKMEINQLIEHAVGRHFIRTYEYLASPGALLDAGITATSDDVTVMNGKAIPPSLLVDAIHGSASYYTLEGNFMARWHRGQGW